MKPNRKSLQRFTESQKRINAVLALEEIHHKDFDGLTKNESDKVCAILTERLSEAKGAERDKIVKQITPFASDYIKNDLWEYNHTEITIAIATLIQEYGRMPSQHELHVKTGLSRVTIGKHLKEYTAHPMYLNEMNQFRFLSDKVLAKVFKFAVNGDMRAAKLFLETVNNTQANRSGNTLIKNQNNYIQINGMVLSQENIKQLNPEQLAQIEAIIQTVSKAAANGK